MPPAVISEAKRCRPIIDPIGDFPDAWSCMMCEAMRRFAVQCEVSLQCHDALRVRSRQELLAKLERSWRRKSEPIGCGA